MDRRRNKKHNNWKNQQNNKNTNFEDFSKPKFNPSNYENSETDKERLKAIEEIKNRENICPICNKLITDLASCLSDKKTNLPIHFECAFNAVEKNENLGENEKIAYIGQGRFGILHYDDIRDQRHFSIKKIIEWEDRDTNSSWRGEISDLYSKVN